ncbi:MAG: hypothetical protein MK179_00095 [Pirellulaceae bacterium]|nr:hypothetical protein [Pirellulaceae bacterium]
MKSARKIVPRLLAIGVILGMGAISIVQGINQDPKEEGTSSNKDLSLHNDATQPLDDALAERTAPPVVAIGDSGIASRNDTNGFGAASTTDGFHQDDGTTNESSARFEGENNPITNDSLLGDERQTDERQTDGLISNIAPLSQTQNQTAGISAAPLPVDLSQSEDTELTSQNPETQAENLDATQAYNQDSVYDPPAGRMNSLRSDPAVSSSVNPTPTDNLQENELANSVFPASSEHDESDYHDVPNVRQENSTYDPLSTYEDSRDDTSDYEDTTLPPNHENQPTLPEFSSAPRVDQDDLGTISTVPTSPAVAADQLVPTESSGQSGGAGISHNEPVDKDALGIPVEQDTADRQFDLSASDPQSEVVAQSTRPQTSPTNYEGKPGPRTLEGQQAPTLTVEKRAPPEIQIGTLAKFQMIVRNIGKVPATGVVVQDEIPTGTRFVGAEPEISTSQGNTLFWNLDTLAPGDEMTVAMQVMPEAEGEIGSVGVVTFHAEASVRTVATRPMLVVEQTTPERVHIGEPVVVRIRVSNPGNGAATSVVLEEDVPEGLSHPAGATLERELGTIRPNETREVELTLSAEKAGLIEHKIVARGDANLVAEDSSRIEIIAPELQVSVSGPGKRYLERQATYSLSVENRGTAPAHNVELVAHLPKGMKFLETNNAGQYDPRSHAVYWSLEKLPADQMGEVQLVTLPIEPGEQKLRFEGQADLGLQDSQEKMVLVDGLASLFFEVADTADPIEVGKPTTYEIRLVNEGSKEATDIALVAELPPGLAPLDANGPERSEISGQQVAFQPLDRLEPGADVYFKIRAEGIAAGHQLIRVHMQSSEMQSPVLEEEDTLVYADQ